jgi:hypothetical protein
MSTLSLGESIVAARMFLNSIHSQVANLLESLDSLMANHGWNPRSNYVSSGISSQLKSDNWLVNYLYRFYSPNNGDRIIGLVIHFDPSDKYGIKEPTCLAFAARFNNALRNDDFVDSTPVFLALRDKPSISTVAEKDHQTFFPNAAALSGIVIPLCDLHSENDLRIRIVDPLLAVLRAEMADRLKQAIGAWPGDEKDEVLDKALEELS